MALTTAAPCPMRRHVGWVSTHGSPALSLQARIARPSAVRANRDSGLVPIGKREAEIVGPEAIVRSHDDSN